MFKFNKEKDKIVRHDENAGYKRLVCEAYEKYPNDKISQLEHVKNYGNAQYYSIMLLAIAQEELCLPSTHSQVFQYDGSILDYLFRSYLDAVRHMQSNLPEGVYKYINGNLDTFILQTLKQTEANKDNKLLKNIVTIEE